MQAVHIFELLKHVSKPQVIAKIPYSFSFRGSKLLFHMYYIII